MYRYVETVQIKGEELERVLLEAAEEVGLKTTSIYEQQTKYSVGPFYSRKGQVYTGTTIRLRGRVLPFAEIHGIKKDEEGSGFSIGNGFNTTPPYFGFSSEKQIEKYLSVVYNHLRSRWTGAGIGIISSI